MPRDFNGTYDTSERFVLQVCHGTMCFCSVQEYCYNARFKAWACVLTLTLFMQTEFFITLFFLNLKARSHGTALIRLHANNVPNKVDFIMVKFSCYKPVPVHAVFDSINLLLLKLEFEMCFILASYKIL